MAVGDVFSIDEGEIVRYLRDPEMRELLYDAALGVADYARDLAPKRSGAGAASIHPEWVDDRLEISWDREHYYMKFSELPTKHMPLHQFLQPAIDRYSAF